MGKHFRSGGIAASTSGSGVAALEAPDPRDDGVAHLREPGGESVDSLTRRLHEELADGGFERGAFARLCRVNAPRLLAAVAQRLERDALPCDGHDVFASAMAQLQRHYVRGGGNDADSALLASIGGARSWFAAVVALALRVVDARSRSMGAAALPQPGSSPPADTPARLAGRRVRFEAKELRAWIGRLLLALPPQERRLVLQARRTLAPTDAGARLRGAADRLFDEVDRSVAAPACELACAASGEARDG
jgi:hypothetical protein